MSIIHRNVTRVILGSTEETLKTRTPNADLLDFNLTTASKLYIGHQEKFSTRYFDLETLNTEASIVSVKAWDGTAYVAVEDVIDQTIGFTRSGFLSWENISNWQKHAQAGVPDKELFWLELTVSANLSAGTKLQSLLNLFCDTDKLRQFFPELVTDTRYLPTGRTSFIDQFIAAKDGIVLRLKQDKIITDESQIIDINEVADAAAHYAAYIILKPIARDEGDEKIVADAFTEYNRLLNQAHKSFDFDRSGEIEDDEKDVGTVFSARGF